MAPGGNCFVGVPTGPALHSELQAMSAALQYPLAAAWEAGALRLWNRLSECQACLNVQYGRRREDLLSAAVSN